MPAAACPPASVLRNFALGQMDDAEIAVVQGHLAECSQCLESILALNARDSLTEDVRNAAVKMSAAEREEAAHLIEKLRGRDWAQSTPPPGMPDRLGPYEIRRPLGAGGMGAVYEAFDPQLRRRVALKVMRPEIACEASFRSRFLREGRTAATLS